MEVFNDSAVNTSLVLLLPYSVLHLYFSYKEKERQLRLLEENQTEAAVRQSVFSFYDEKNELRLSVKRSNLLYLESADNYVCIWYLNKGQLTKFMLRNSLKAIEESLADTNKFRPSEGDPQGEGGRLSGAGDRESTRYPDLQDV